MRVPRGLAIVFLIARASMAADDIDRLETISITAPALPSQGVHLRDDLGSASYSVDQHRIEELAAGEVSSLDTLAIHLPGVSADSKSSGGFHIRNEHGNIQYRINGIQLPDSLSSFGASLDTGIIDRMDLLTGVLPAQYGLHTAGVIDIETRQDDLGVGGAFNLGLGSVTHPFGGLQVFGGHDSGSGFLSISGLHTPLGIENPNPTSTALHDDSTQYRFFAHWLERLSEHQSIAALVGRYQGRFEIPNRLNESPLYTGFATGITTNSRDLNDQQNERTDFTALSSRYLSPQFGSALTFFQQSAEIRYLPDPHWGDVAFLGASSESYRSLVTHGLLWDAHFDAVPHHVIRWGAAWISTLSQNVNAVTVLTPQNNPSTLETIQDNSGLFGITRSLYLQDEWHLLDHWQLNTGLRWDQVNAYTTENQTSPRIQLSYRPNTDTLIHVGFAEYFTPPPQELAAQKSIALYNNTTNAAEVSYSDTVRAERSRYWDLGINVALNPVLNFSIDAYFKRSRNLLDEGQFGQAMILSPYNYQEGLQRGIEVSVTTTQKTLSTYLNIAWARGEAHNIISGQALFGAQELQTISQRSIFLDHDQTWTGSLGAVVHVDRLDIALDMVAGSGLRRTGADGIPNQDHLPGYASFDLAAVQHFKWSAHQKFDARLALINVFDRRYLLRDGTGVGVGAPQYGAARTVFAGATIHF